MWTLNKNTCTSNFENNYSNIIKSNYCIIKFITWCIHLIWKQSTSTINWRPCGGFTSFERRKMLRLLCRPACILYRCDSSIGCACACACACIRLVFFFYLWRTSFATWRRVFGTKLELCSCDMSVQIGNPAVVFIIYPGSSCRADWVWWPFECVLAMVDWSFFHVWIVF